MSYCVTALIKTCLIFAFQWNTSQSLLNDLIVPLPYYLSVLFLYYTLITVASSRFISLSTLGSLLWLFHLLGMLIPRYHLTSSLISFKSLLKFYFLIKWSKHKNITGCSLLGSLWLESWSQSLSYPLLVDMLFR